MAISTNLYFLMDLITNFIVFGPSFIAKHKKILFLEILIQIGMLFATYRFITLERPSESGRVHAINGKDPLSLFISCGMLRMWELSYMLDEIYDFKIIFATFSKFSWPFASLMATVYCVFYVYAVIGQLMF